MILNEDFFDNIESTDIVNDEIETDNESINISEYSHMLKVNLEIAEFSVMKNIRLQKSPEIDEFVATLKNIIKKINYILDADKFVTKHSKIIINQHGVEPINHVVTIKSVDINTNRKYGFENIKYVDLVYYATFNITNAKQAVNFYSQQCEGFLNRNTMFYVNSLTIQRIKEDTYTLLSGKKFDFDTKVPFFEKQENIYELYKALSDRKDIYSNILKCYSDNNASFLLFEYSREYRHFSSTFHGKELMLKDKTVAKELTMLNVPDFANKNAISCYGVDISEHYKPLLDWMKHTPFELHTLVKDDEKLEYKVVCVFNGTYTNHNKEYIIVLSSSCANMSELDAHGDKAGFYTCLKMIQSLGYSEKDALNILKSDFTRFDETVYDEYIEQPELFKNCEIVSF